MARAKIKAQDTVNIKKYAILTAARIDFDNGNWFLDTPDFSKLFHSTAEMMDFINEDLECMEEAYRRNGELSEWKDIERQAQETPFQFSFESDRIDRRRYRHGRV